MKKIMILILSVVLFPIIAQNITIETRIDKYNRWFLLDWEKDKMQGMSVEKAYDFIHQKHLHAVPVIVAIIDAGIDTNHEDLKQKLWVNQQEIRNNHLDDDHNGYIDDIHGWNFLGNIKGENIIKAPSEEYRLYKNLKKQFQSSKDSTLLQDSLYIRLSGKLDKDTMNIDLASLMILKRMDSIFTKVIGDTIFTRAMINRSDTLPILSNPYIPNFIFPMILAQQNNLQFLEGIKKILYKKKKDTLKNRMLYATLCGIDTMFQKHFCKSIYDKNDLQRLPYMKNLFLLMYYINLWDYTQQEDTTRHLLTNKDLFKYLTTNKYKVVDDVREKIIGDNVEDIHDNTYGNNEFPISNAEHGTHVAGIIGADRHNQRGIKGIADSVRLMILRVVPDGDEYDKDIALAIFYAVNNGAKIINMSFGKPYSPHKIWIDSAIQYAASKNVLLVHAAGNDAKNLNIAKNYPNPNFVHGGRAFNYITVGAIGINKKGKAEVADFSNYGNYVEVFAPGEDIYSCIPNNQYQRLSGTSMAAPMVSGLAAMLWSYFPNLSAVDIRNIIIESAIPIHFSKKQVHTPLLQKIKIVNAYNAIKQAFEQNK